MQRIDIDLGARAYGICIGAGLDYGELLAEVAGQRRDLLIVTSATVAALYLDRAERQFARAGFRVRSLTLPDGEAHKDVTSYLAIMEALLRHGYGRDCMLAALGGGVIGDVTGFAAATYQRGVAYVQLPTTLLAMVDSAVGGKTAINHELGKNMIGAFCQPLCVLSDLEVLDTLPRAEISAGLGEVIKYGLIADAAFYEYLRGSLEAVFRREQVSLSNVVRRCCEIKAEVVAGDEREHGRRAILNFGHTFGHAIETHTNYEVYLHGQAVGLGMAIACALCVRRGTLSAGELTEIRDLLAAADLPVELPAGMTGGDFIAHMRHDKKVRSGTIRYVLLRRIGEACLVSDVSDEEVLALIASLGWRG